MPATGVETWTFVAGNPPHLHKELGMTENAKAVKPAHIHASETTTLSDRERFQVEDASGYWLVLEGDWGGQIYLTVPFALVGPNARIFDLLREIDGHEWSCNEGDGAGALLYSPEASLQEMISMCPEIEQELVDQLREAKMHYSGGCGGGELTDGLWTKATGECLAHFRAMLDLR